MSVFVLDASTTLSWVFEDEQSLYANAIMASLAARHAVVPQIWPLEIANVLLSATRRVRILEADGLRFFATLEHLEIEIDRSSDLAAISRKVFPLGLAHGLSSYDASYLDLALRRGLPLATLDRRLRDAASEVGVTVLQP